MVHRVQQQPDRSLSPLYIKLGSSLKVATMSINFQDDFVSAVAGLPQFYEGHAVDVQQIARLAESCNHIKTFEQFLIANESDKLSVAKKAEVRAWERVLKTEFKNKSNEVSEPVRLDAQSFQAETSRRNHSQVDALSGHLDVLLSQQTGHTVYKSGHCLSLSDRLFQDESFVSMQFTGADLINSNWYRCNLTKADFSFVKAQGARFQQANFTGGFLKGALLEQAVFVDCQFQGCSFKGADLRKTNFSGNDLKGVDFKNADLTDADLSNCNLTGANLEGANLTRTNLLGANLTGTSLKKANVSLKAKIAAWLMNL